VKGDRIAYYSGICFQLGTTYQVQTDLHPLYDITTEYIDLTMGGLLTIRHGYGWDGVSFEPLRRNKMMMRGSLVHDALADLARKGFLDQRHFHAINKELEKICEEDGVPESYGEWIYFAVDVVSNGKWAKFGEDSGRKLQFAP
jgi:hypothetical protein